MAVSSRAARRWAAPGRRVATRADTTRLRVLWLLAVAILLAGAIWARLAYWQIVRHDDLVQRAARYQLEHRVLAATRGAIYDRDGVLLADDVPVYDITVAPDQLHTAAVRQQVADGLAGQLGMRPEDVMKVIARGGQFQYVKQRQPKDVADKISALTLPGVGEDPQTQRVYFQGGTQDVTLASSLLGFVSNSGTGQQGVERYYNRQLAGRNGYIESYVDAQGDQISLSTQRHQSPMDGSDLHLTLDSAIQYAAEQALADGVKAAHAKSGSVIVMDTHTGGIAAWASWPAYNANQFGSSDPGSLGDPIASDLYEPGSIMKVVTLAGAIDQGKITPDTTIQDPGYIVVGGQRLRDWDRAAHGTVTMTKVLEDSLNVGAVRAEQAEGQDAFLHYLDAFGVGKASGVDVANEAVSPLRASYRPVEAATAAFGQGVAVNMVEMCAAVNAIANGGRWVQPHVLQSVGDHALPAAASRQVVSPQTAATMTQMMESVVQHGSGYMARVAGFENDEAGKTGTSNIPEGGVYSDADVWASYAGFLPASNPRFTMLVMVTQPNTGNALTNEGYYVSAPIWKRIAEQIIQRWRITSGPVSPSN